MKLICSSCGINVVGQDDFVKFNCPSCGEGVIIRCRKCRNLAVPYKCEKCEFEGP